MNPKLIFHAFASLMVSTATAEETLPKDAVKSITITVQSYEVLQKDPLVAQVQAPQADAKVLLQKLIALAARGQAKVAAIASLNTKSGQRAKTGDDTGKLQVEPVIGADGNKIDMTVAFHHGPQKLEVNSTSAFGGTVFLGTLNNGGKGTVELVFARISAQLSISKTAP